MGRLGQGVRYSSPTSDSRMSDVGQTHQKDKRHNHFLLKLPEIKGRKKYEPKQDKGRSSVRPTASVPSPGEAGTGKSRAQRLLGEALVLIGTALEQEEHGMSDKGEVRSR